MDNGNEVCCGVEWLSIGLTEERRIKIRTKKQRYHRQAQSAQLTEAEPGNFISPESSGSPSNACIRDTCTTDRSDHHPRRHAAGSTEDPDHAYHLLLDEVEAHGDQAHPGEYVERAGAQAEFLQGGGRRVSSNRHQVPETDCSEAGEAEVATFQKAPTFQPIEHHRAAAYVDQHDHQTETDRYPHGVRLHHVTWRRTGRQGQRARVKVAFTVSRRYILKKIIRLQSYLPKFLLFFQRKRCTWRAAVELVVAWSRPSLPQSRRIALLVPLVPRSSQELSLLAE